MFGGDEVFENFTEDDYEFYLEKMKSDLQLEIRRKSKETGR